MTKKTPSDRKKAKNIFCNNSCAASYNNKHKNYGTRRSKLEKYLETQLKLLYPNLEIVTNNKQIINSELDFYFPQLKFAIELNGPTHYEPIYGQEKFEKIVQNDKQKIIKCYEKGIELLVIDVSTVSYLTNERKKYYLNLFKKYVEKLKHRLE
jgi:very-short-patch-repair endonuclease